MRLLPPIPFPSLRLLLPRRSPQSLLRLPFLFGLALSSSRLSPIRSVSATAIPSIGSLLLALLTTTYLSACSARTALTSSIPAETAIVSNSRPLPIPRLQGTVSLARLASALRATGYAIGSASADEVYLNRPANFHDLESQLAAQGIAIAGGQFVRRQAFHPIESPDALGRPVAPTAFEVRERFRLDLEFWRVSATADIRQLELTAGGQRAAFQFIGSAGVNVPLGNVTERSFFNRFIVPGQDGNATNSDRQTVTAGVQWQGMMGAIGNIGRLEGAVSVSSFLGEGLDRAQTTVPVVLDLGLGEWVPVAIVDGSDVSAAAAFRSFDWRLRASGERVVVRVRLQRLVGVERPVALLERDPETMTDDELLAGIRSLQAK